MTAASLSYCGGEVRTHDRERFLTALFAPSEHREALFTLYAFNLEVAKTAEVVSEPMLGRIRLQWWREALDGLYGGTPRQHAVVEPLSEIVERHDLPRALFDRIIDGRERDLEDEPPADLQALEAYAADTSGALTRLAALILGLHDEQTLEAAEAVGTAWALVGLLRAVAFHAAQKRVFLPRALTARHGLERSELFELRSSEALAAVAEEIAQRAAQYLAQARTQSARFKRSGLAAVLPAVIARHYIRRLQRCGWDPLAPKIQHPDQALALKLLTAYLLCRF